MYTQGWYHVLRRFDRTTNQVIVLYQPAADERFGGAPPLAFSPQDPHVLYMAAQHVLASSDRGETWRSDQSGSRRAAGRPPSRRRPRAAGGVGAPAAGGSITDARAVAGRRRRHLGRHEHRADPRHARQRQDVDERDAAEPAAGEHQRHRRVARRRRHGVRGAAVARRASAHLSHQRLRRELAGDLDRVSPTARSCASSARIRSIPAFSMRARSTSVYVSFDRGDHWQSLQLNLPTTVVSDLTVHDNDLVISTYGRGFWILDDVVAAAAGARGAGDRRRRRSSSSRRPRRARGGTTRRTRRCRPRWWSARTRPRGRSSTTTCASPASGPMTLTISDASGGRDPRILERRAAGRHRRWPNVPEYWLAPPPVLPTAAGMHRVAWDLRYPDPPTLNYGYSGTPLDYREYTLSWHAIPGQDAAVDAGRADGAAGHLHREADGERPELHAADHRRRRIRASPCRRPRSRRSSACSSAWSRDSARRIAASPTSTTCARR